MADPLRDELLADPLGRGYSAMTDQEAADDLNLVNRTRNLVGLSGDEVAQAADPAEYNALADGAANNTADVKGQWLALCGRVTIDPFAVANVQLVIAIFGAGSTTVSNLNALRVESITRAQELGLPLLNGLLLVGYVTSARAA